MEFTKEELELIAAAGHAPEVVAQAITEQAEGLRAAAANPAQQLGWFIAEKARELAASPAPESK